MSLADAAGLVGVLMILAAYAAATLGRLDPKRALSLAANFVGACLILWSLSRDFNLSAAVMEGAWALVALLGLVRLGIAGLKRG
jgi:drug/metabolite transporter (DMT)-like permease